MNPRLTTRSRVAGTRMKVATRFGSDLVAERVVASACEHEYLAAPPQVGVYRIDGRVPIDTPVTASWTPSASSPSEKQRPRKNQNRGGRTNLTWRPWQEERRDLLGRQRPWRRKWTVAAMKKTRPRRRRRDAGLARERGEEVFSSAREVERRRMHSRIRVRGRKECQVAKNGNLVFQTVRDEIFLFCQIF